MKDGIGEGYTREDHSDVSNQLFASLRQGAGRPQPGLALSARRSFRDTDKQYLEFGTAV